MDVQVVVISHPNRAYQVCVFAIDLGRSWVKLYNSKRVCFAELRSIELISKQDFEESVTSDFEKTDEMMIFSAHTDPPLLESVLFVEQKRERRTFIPQSAVNVEEAGPIRDVQLLLKKIVRVLVSDQAAVHVEAQTLESEILLRLHVSMSDVCNVIGKAGCNVRSIRTILAALSAKTGVRFRLAVLET